MAFAGVSESSPHRMELGQAAEGLLSSDSEQVHQVADVSSGEFERLMEDSICSEPVAAGFGSAVSAAAIARSPRGVLESPQRWPGRVTDLGGASPLLRASGALGGDAGEAMLASGPTSAALTLSPSAVAPQSTGRQQLAGSDDAAGFPRSEDPWIMSQLSGRLDAIAREMKRSVEHEFALAERTLMGQQRSAMEAQKMKADALAYQQQASFESLQSDNLQLSRRLEFKQRQLKDSLSLLQRARRGLVGRCAQERVICAWKAVAAAEKDSRLNQLLAAGLHCKRSAAQLFGAWRRLAHLAAMDKSVSHERATADMVRAKLFEQMELERTRTASEMDRLTKLLKEEQQQRALLQENLKRVFMRGVCALNFEAMTLLSDGTSAEAVPGGQVLPAASGFDWAGFEAQALGCTGPSGGAVSVSSEPTAGVTGVAAPAPLGTNLVGSTSVQMPAAEPQVVASPAGTRPSSPSQASSPRRPPVPSQPPMQASGQLPFVNWSSPPATVQQPAARVARGSNVRVPSRGQLRHPSSAARGLAHPRPEMVTVG